MKILITGGNGYVGRGLYRALKDKYTVDVIPRPLYDLRLAISTRTFFKYELYDVVLHTAISGGHRLWEDGAEVLDNNLRMYYNLLGNRECFKRFINFGSGAEFYKANEPYGMSKKVIRNSILEKDNFYNIRLYGLFDEDELDTRFIKANIKRYIDQEPMVVHQDKYMDFFYMEDLVKVVEYYITEPNPKHKEFECNYDNYKSLLQITDMINELSDYKVDVTVETPGKGEGYVASKATKLPLDYVGLEKGIREVYNKLK